jgi:hypothetical protein
MFNLNKEIDPNFGYGTREDYEKAIERMSMLMWSEFGKKINLDLLREGKLQNKKFTDITDPKELPLVLLENHPNNSRIIDEFDGISEALNLSYKMLSFYQDSIDNYKLSDVTASLTPTFMHFGIQGHITLEVMREMLSNNSSDYFNQKIEAESKAA